MYVTLLAQQVELDILICGKANFICLLVPAQLEQLEISQIFSLDSMVMIHLSLNSNQLITFYIIIITLNLMVLRIVCLVLHKYGKI
jgi:hypothetical protein